MRSSDSAQNSFVRHIDIQSFRGLKDPILTKLVWLTPKGQSPIWRPKTMSGHAIVNAFFTQ
jgi:hypothetical protein